MKGYTVEQYVRSVAQILVFIVYVLLVSVTSHVTAQVPRSESAQKPQSAAPTVRFASGNSALKIPLEIDNNIILMRVSVNGSKPLRFIFDTGASHTIINSQRAAELGLKTQGQAHGTATGGAIQGSYITGVSLSVQGAEVSNQLIASIAFPPVPGFEFDGTIGYDFINQFVVEIDYQNKIMNLYDPRTHRYSGKGEIIPLILAGRRTPLARTKLILVGRAPVESNLEVDTGADGTFVINSPFAQRQKLVEAIQKTTQDTRNGAGGEQKVLVGRFKAVKLGRFVLENPTVALSQDTEGGESEESDGVIGGEIFRRFKVILDYSRKQMILEPNKSFNDPYDVDSGGE